MRRDKYKSNVHNIYEDKNERLMRKESFFLKPGVIRIHGEKFYVRSDEEMSEKLTAIFKKMLMEGLEEKYGTAAQIMERHKKKAKEDGIRSIALNMLKDNVNPNIISKYTNLTRRQIESLRSAIH